MGPFWGSKVGTKHKPSGSLASVSVAAGSSAAAGASPPVRGLGFRVEGLGFGVLKGSCDVLLMHEALQDRNMGNGFSINGSTYE